MSKKLDPDLLALKRACKALDGSTSWRMLQANCRFILDRYMVNVPDYVLRKYERDANRRRAQEAP